MILCIYKHITSPLSFQIYPKKDLNVILFIVYYKKTFEHVSFIFL